MIQTAVEIYIADINHGSISNAETIRRPNKISLMRAIFEDQEKKVSNFTCNSGGSPTTLRKEIIKTTKFENSMDEVLIENRLDSTPFLTKTSLKPEIEGGISSK